MKYILTCIFLPVVFKKYIANVSSTISHRCSIKEMFDGPNITALANVQNMSKKLKISYAWLIDIIYSEIRTRVNKIFNR